MIVTRKVKQPGDWWVCDPLTDARITSLDRGGVHGGEQIALRAKKDGEDYYRTMVVVYTTYFQGATIFKGFVTDDEAEDTYRYHVEEWTLLQDESVLAQERQS